MISRSLHVELSCIQSEHSPRHIEMRTKSITMATMLNVVSVIFSKNLEIQ